MISAFPKLHHGSYVLSLIASGSMLLTSDFLVPIAIMATGLVGMIGLAVFCEWAISRRLSHVHRMDEKQLLDTVSKAIAPLVEQAGKAAMIIDGYAAVTEQHTAQVRGFRAQLEENTKVMVKRLDDLEARIEQINHEAQARN